MFLSQFQVLIIVIGIQCAIAATMFLSSAREIKRNRELRPEGPIDGYSLVVSICTALLAFFGIWAVYKVGEIVGVEVNLGGHNVLGVFLIAFFSLLSIGVFLVLLGRAKLLEISNHRRLEQ